MYTLNTRGEKQYINMPSFAARLYDNLTGIKGVIKGFEEIADFINTHLNQGRLLDIGADPGRLLSAINKKCENIELYGLDISASMINLAKQNLQNIRNIQLQVGNITDSVYNSDYFDCIVSTGSFYNWDQPVKGLNEIFRILKPGRTAYIYDSYKDCDKKLLMIRLKSNLRAYSYFRRQLSVYFLKKQLNMTYTLKEYDELLSRSEFRKTYNLTHIELGNLPVYIRLELKKE